MIVRVNRTTTPMGSFYTVIRHDDGLVLMSTYALMGSVVESVGDRGEVYFDWPHDPVADVYDVDAGTEVPKPAEEE